MADKKIALIGPVYPYKGGISHYTALMYRALSKVYQVKMISYKMQYPKVLFKKEQKDYANKSFAVEGTEFLIHTANPFNIISAAAQIRKEGYDAIIVQWWHPYFAPCYRLLESRWKAEKIIFVCHNVFPHERFLLDRFLTRMVLRRGDGFIVHSQMDAEDLKGICGETNYVLTPLPSFHAFQMQGMTGEEARRQLGIPSDEKVLLFFGFVRKYKGLRHLLRAMPQITERYPESRLLIVGDFGNDRKEYFDLIDETGISDTVRVVEGYVPDREVEKYFAACDLVVLPYESATQSGIVQIAFGFERPVVVTAVGGLPDVVEDHKTGYVVSPQNAGQIADAVIDFWENDRTEEYHRNIRQAAERFSWERMTEAVQSLIEKEET